MRTALTSLLGAALMLSGCAMHHPSAATAAGQSLTTGDQLRSGDVVVAVARGKSRTAVLRLHSGLRPRAQLNQLFVTAYPVRGLAASSDGRWLALQTEEAEGDRRVRLWDLRHAPGEAEPTAVWSSPLGCSQPDFDSSSRWMVLGCPRRARQPASVLRVDLPSLESLQLVGEADRRAPIVGVEGDVYWAERRERHTVAVRRSGGGSPFVTHDLTESIKEMWPQADGSLVAELDRRGSGRGFARLSASGVARIEVPPASLEGLLSRESVVHVGARGVWWVASCERGPCSLRWVTRSDQGSGVALGGAATAIAEVAWPQPRTDHPEDLATAPASVLSSHPSTRVAVLGISLGMSLQDAFAILDRVGRHPYWIESRMERRRPRGIGVGWTSAGHCIEYLADERNVVTAIELRGCATSYVSPALRPLLDRNALAEEGVGVARRFLGEDVSVEVGGNDAAGRHEPVRRTEVSFSSPERGYLFEARSEVLRANRSRVLGGWVRLRLQLPGRRQASVRRP